MKVYPVIWLLLIAFAPLLGACCNFDLDTLEQEAARHPGIRDVIAGRFDRTPPAILENELATLNGVTEPGPLMRRAEVLAQLGRADEGWATLYVFEEGQGGGVPDDLRLRYDMLKIQIGLLRMLRSRGPQRAAEIAAELTEPLEPLFGKAVTRLVQWLLDAPPVKVDEMLPDMLGLRLAGNKTAIADNSQLADAGLGSAVGLLILMLQFHPDWENVDTYYALSLVMAVEGKQHLAHYARMRVHELLDAGHTTRLPVPDPITDLRPLLIPRKLQTGALVEIRTLDEPQKQWIADEYQHRRKHTVDWNAARQDYVSRMLLTGKTGLEADFWAALPQPLWQPLQAATGTGPAVADTANAAAPGNATSQESAREWSSSGAVAGAAAATMVMVVLLLHRRRKPESKQP
ncbi:MAG: hypothetical protein KF754_03945 [Planctomycetes bacterium]|nr:hypothetical protein [Planctomycetota bacterium]